MHCGYDDVYNYSYNDADAAAADDDNDNNNDNDDDNNEEDDDDGGGDNGDDDDADDSYASSSIDKDEFNFYTTTPNVITDMHGNQFNHKY